MYYPQPTPINIASLPYYIKIPPFLFYLTYNNNNGTNFIVNICLSGSIGIDNSKTSDDTSHQLEQFEGVHI